MDMDPKSENKNIPTEIRIERNVDTWVLRWRKSHAQI
jgi:hypothetical protein